MLDLSWTPDRLSGRAAQDSLSALSDIGARYASVPPYNDEPKTINLTAIFPGDLESRGLGRASGSSLLIDRAALKLLGEAVERLSALPPPEIHKWPRLAFGDQESPALDPEQLSFSCRETQPQRTDLIRWIDGVRLGCLGQEVSLVPAKLVFLPYELTDEPLWWLSTSNGLAAGECIEHAAYAGLLELIEREALMYFWENPETAMRVEINASVGPLGQLIEMASRYALAPNFLILKAPYQATFTILCYVEDVVREGPHGSLGLKSGSDFYSVALGALEEAIQIRPWLRELAEAPLIVPSALRTIDDRAAWWLSEEGRKQWYRRWRTVPRGVVAASAVMQKNLSLGSLIEDFAQVSGDVWIVPVRSVWKELAVARVICPRVAPIYFDEEYRIVSEDEHVFASSTRHPLL